MITDGSNNTGTDNEAQAEENGAAANSPSAENNAASQIADLEAKLQEADKKYLYLYSEFENFRRRNERERIDFLKFGHESFLRDLLQVLDNFERALSHSKSLSPEKGTPLAIVSQGVEMIHFQLLETLRSQGVSEIACSGKKFDPAFHEAVGEENSDHEAGMILRDVQKGYLLHGRLLRAAKVIVAKK